MSLVYAEVRMEWSWIRQLAFWVGLLLALCILDSRIPRGEWFPSLQSEDEHHLLTVQPLLVDKEISQIDSAPVLPASVGWVTRVLREERFIESPASGATSIGYRPVGELRGEVSRKRRGVGELSLAPGIYWTITRAPGYSRFVQRIEHLSPTQLEPPLTLAASLSVRVMVDRNDVLTPLARATVLVGERKDLAFGAQTNDAGLASFADLPPGPSAVRIFAPGYEPYEGVAEGELLVRLRPVSTLRVRVVDDGVPQADATVFIAGVSLWPARSTKTDGLGAVDIAGLKPGKYSLYALKGARISRTAGGVEVRSETELVEVELSLEKGRFVPVLVQEKAKETPVQGARVTWSSAGLGQFSLHTLSDSQGRATVGPLSEAGGVLSVRAKGFVGRVVPVDLPEPQGAPQLVELLRAAVVEGRILDPEGFPVRGATVEVSGTDIFGMPVSVTFQSEEVTDAHFDWAMDQGNVVVPAGELGVMLGPVPPIPLGDLPLTGGQRLTSDERGYFRAEGVPPGEIVVLVRHPDYMDGRSGVLTLNPGDTRKTEIVLGRGQALLGRVLDFAGFPVPYARVQVTGRKFDRRVTAESDGTFELKAAPERVTVSVSTMEQPLRTIFSREVLSAERAEEIKIDLPEPRKDATIVVVDHAGEEVELCQITLISLDKNVPFKQTGFTAEDGSLVFAETRGLSVKMQAKAPGFVENEWSVVLKEDNRLTLRASINATGRITSVRGRLPAPDAEVVFKSGSVVRRATTNEFGSYRLTGLPPGRGELSATHAELGSSRLALSVNDPGSGRDAELPTLDLAPALQISGRVEDQRGVPIAGAVISDSRISPYLSGTGRGETLGVSDAGGAFTVSVERATGLHLYAAKRAHSFGWSEAISFGDRNELSDVVIVVDHEDKAEPDILGTVLIGLSEAPLLRIYAVAEGSRAARADLRIDDEIIEIGGETPRDIKDARELLSGLPGSDLRLLVRRNGQTIDLLVSREGFVR